MEILVIIFKFIPEGNGEIGIKSAGTEFQAVNYIAKCGLKKTALRLILLTYYFSINTLLVLV